MFRLVFAFALSPFRLIFCFAVEKSAALFFCSYVDRYRAIFINVTIYSICSYMSAYDFKCVPINLSIDRLDCDTKYLCFLCNVIQSSLWAFCTQSILHIQVNNFSCIWSNEKLFAINFGKNSR